MSAVASLPGGWADEAGRNMWQLAWRRFRADRFGVISAVVVMLGLVMCLASAAGVSALTGTLAVGPSTAPPAWWAQAPTEAKARASAALQVRKATETDIQDPIGADLEAAAQSIGRHSRQDRPPTATDITDPIADEMAQAQQAVRRLTVATPGLVDATLWMGTDKWGRDVLAKTIKGAQTSILVGLSAALLATLIGAVLGAVTGWFGGWVDDLGNWVYNVIHAIPSILLILAIAAVLGTKGEWAIVLILGLTSWTGVYRLMRGEYMKQRQREYVRAAEAIGASAWRQIFVHVLPNVSHVLLVQFSLLTVACIKAEVILSYLGFGVPVDGVSWGTMLTEAQNDLLVGKWWQLLSATLAMSIFVTALSLLTDALRDALDPRIVQQGEAND
ncbi:MAG: ABC transporter permease [Limnohabitans sp.]